MGGTPSTPTQPSRISFTRQLRPSVARDKAVAQRPTFARVESIAHAPPPYEPGTVSNDASTLTVTSRSKGDGESPGETENASMETELASMETDFDAVEAALGSVSVVETDLCEMQVDLDAISRQGDSDTACVTQPEKRAQAMEKGGKPARLVLATRWKRAFEGMLLGLLTGPLALIRARDAWYIGGATTSMLTSATVAVTMVVIARS